jgi:hypothetical protein
LEEDDQRASINSQAAMETDDYDDPQADGTWCDQQRLQVTEYLRSQGLEHGRIGDRPAWHVAPYVSIWAIESLVQPEWIGWWAISGDLPTDYISAADIEPPQHPRKALRAIAERWFSIVGAWGEGREYEGYLIAGGRQNRELAPLLNTRAKMLIRWTDDDSLWEDE